MVVERQHSRNDEICLPRLNTKRADGRKHHDVSSWFALSVCCNDHSKFPSLSENSAHAVSHCSYRRSVTATLISLSTTVSHQPQWLRLRGKQEAVVCSLNNCSSKSGYKCPSFSHCRFNLGLVSSLLATSTAQVILQRSYLGKTQIMILVKEERYNCLVQTVYDTSYFLLKQEWGKVKLYNSLVHCVQHETLYPERGVWGGGYIYNSSVHSV